MAGKDKYMNNTNYLIKGGGWLLWVKMASSYNSTERRGEIIIEIKKFINRICLIAWLTICKTSLCPYVQVVRAVCLLE